MCDNNESKNKEPEIYVIDRHQPKQSKVFHLRRAFKTGFCPVFDAHMHIMSARCSPVQVQAGILAERTKKGNHRSFAKRRFYEISSGVDLFCGEMGDIGRNDSDIIGLIYMESMKIANLDLFTAYFNSAVSESNKIRETTGPENHPVYQLDDFIHLFKNLVYYYKSKEDPDDFDIVKATSNDVGKLQERLIELGEKHLKESLQYRLEWKKKNEIYRKESNKVDQNEGNPDHDEFCIEGSEIIGVQVNELFDLITDLARSSERAEKKTFRNFCLPYYDNFNIKIAETWPGLPKYLSISYTVDFLMAHYWGRYGIPLYFNSTDKYYSGKREGIRETEQKSNEDYSMIVDYFSVIMKPVVNSSGIESYELEVDTFIASPKTSGEGVIHLFPDFDFRSAAGFSRSTDKFIDIPGNIQGCKYIHLVNYVPSRLKDGKREYQLYENFEEQLENTRYVTMKYPLEFFPFYFFEPRRFVKNFQESARVINNNHAFYSYEVEDVGAGEKYTYAGKPLLNKLVLRPVNINWDEVIGKNYRMIENCFSEVFVTGANKKRTTSEECSAKRNESSATSQAESEASGLKSKALSNALSNSVSNAVSKGVFWGYKMYTRYGYRPDDYVPLNCRCGLKNDGNLYKIDGGAEDFEGPQYYPQLAEFYTHCVNNNIPIVCHCNAGGSIFNDVYNLERFDWNRKWGNDGSFFNTMDITYDHKKSVDWLDHHYVAPHNWERVLETYPTLKINLAHFGGGDKWESFTGDYEKKNHQLYIGWKYKICELVEKYANVYTDLSYWEYTDPCEFVPGDDVNTASEKRARNIGIAAKTLAHLIDDYPSLKYRIMVGSDWYLMEFEKTKTGDGHQRGTGYLRTWLYTLLRETMRYMKETDRFDAWYQFSVINPLKFLGIIDDSKNDNPCGQPLNPNVIDNDEKPINTGVIDNYKTAMENAIKDSNLNDDEKKQCLQKLDLNCEMFKSNMRIYRSQNICNDDNFIILQKIGYDNNHISIPKISDAEYKSFFEKTVRDSYLKQLMDHEYLGTCDSYCKGEWKSKGKNDYIDLVKNFLNARGVKDLDKFKSQSKTKTLFITCDDYGVSEIIDRGIEMAIESGNITSVTVFANGEYYKGSSTLMHKVSHLYDLGIKKNPNFEIGIHLTISSGYPLTSCPILCDLDNTKLKNAEGKWPFQEYNKINADLFRLKMNQDTLEGELEAQILQLKDLPFVTFITSHHNALNYSEEMFSVFLKLARRYGLAIRGILDLPKFKSDCFYITRGDWGCIPKNVNLRELIDSNNEDSLENPDFQVKCPDCLHMGHFGPPNLLSMDIVDTDSYQRNVKHKQTKLRHILESFLKNDELDSMEVILHLGKYRDDEVDPRLPFLPKSQIPDLKYPGVDLRYFQSRVMEYESIKEAEISDSDLFRTGRIRWGKWSELGNRNIDELLNTDDSAPAPHALKEAVTGLLQD